jgi:hypothetical protein
MALGMEASGEGRELVAMSAKLKGHGRKVCGLEGLVRLLKAAG